MTISQELQFNVLSAPIAASDRRALSQAWYSALYGTRAKAPAPAPRRSGPTKSEPLKARNVRVVPASPTDRRIAAPIARTGNDASKGAPVQTERRSVRSALSRAIEGAMLRPKSAPQRAALVLASAHGRVQLFLHGRGAHMRLIAVCSERDSARVARALEEARYALAARGVALHAQTRSAAC